MSKKPKLRLREARVVRANAPRLFVCPACGETLSGPARFYLYCPGPVPRPARKAPALVFGRALA